MLEEVLLIDNCRVAVIGSRDYDKLELVDEFIGTLPPTVVIVSGEARGVDTAAKNAAEKRGMGYKGWEPEWRRYGKKLAPIIRNRQIVHDADIVVAFWNGYSTGTKDAIDFAERLGRPVFIFD